MMSVRLVLLLAYCGLLFGQQHSLEEVKTLLDRGEPAKAIPPLKEIVGNEPNNAVARVLLGSALADTGQRDEAIAQFEEALRLKPNDPEAHAELGIVLLEKGEVAGAAQQLDRALKIFGDTPDAAYPLYVRARIYSRQGDFKKTVDLLQQAVSLRPDLAEAWSDLGMARKALFDNAGALHAFQRAVALRPKDAVSQYRLGDEYLHQNRIDPAVEHLEKAYRLNPEDQSTLNALQMALRRAGKTAEADQIRHKLAALLVARDQANQNVVAAIRTNNEGAKLEKAGDLRGAMEKYREALKLEPQHNGIRVNYAIALLRLGQWTEGLNELHEASLRDPNNAQIQAALKDALSQAPPALIPTWNNDKR